MTRASRALGTALAVLLIGANSVSAQEDAAGAPAAPAGEVVATHGSWQVRCADEQDESGRICVMGQTGKDSSGDNVLELQFRKLAGAKAPDGTPIPAAVQILTPLGVLLPAGVRIKVDANKERVAPYEVCAPTGCVVRQPLSADFLNELKGGANATVTLMASPQEEIPVTISLIGFTKAFDSL